MTTTTRKITVKVEDLEYGDVLTNEIGAPEVEDVIENEDGTFTVEGTTRGGTEWSQTVQPEETFTVERTHETG